MSNNEEVQFVTFTIAESQFGLSVFDVERVLRYEKPTPLPKAPAFLEGMFPYGDASVPMVDLRRRLNVDADVNEETRLLVVRWEEGLVGFVVDTVSALRTVPVVDIKTPPPMVRGLAATYISGIVHLDDETLIILAAGSLLSSTERLELAPVHRAVSS